MGRRTLAGVALLAIVAPLAGCSGGRRTPTYPPAGATPIIATTQTAAARAAVVAALGGTGFQVVDASQPYRPPEGPWLAAAPRTVLELDAPGRGPVGFVVLYGLGSPTDAATAAADQASYIAAPIGRVYFPNDAHFTIQVLGSSVIFFTWSPATADPGLAQVERALAGVGARMAVPG